MTKPSLDELRQVCQPPEVMSRRSAEHWVGRLYGRKLSIRITSILVRTSVQADHVTYLMIVVGLLGATALLIPTILGPVLAALAIQLYLVLDCVDGEIARWRRQTSKRGVYLDRLGHYIVEAALFTAYGFHVGQSLQSGWLSVGLATALFAIIAKAETDLVVTAGGDLGEHNSEVVTPRSPTVRALRQLTYPLRIHRLLGAVEVTLLMVVVALVQLVYDRAEEIAAGALLGLSAVVMIGHGLSVLTSKRFD